MELFVDLKVSRLRQEWSVCDKLDNIQYKKRIVPLYQFGVSVHKSCQHCKT